MEFLGFQQALSFLLSTDMVITSFISNRHAGIAKWMREECPKHCKQLGKSTIDHYYDCWHVAKSKYNTYIGTLVLPRKY